MLVWVETVSAGSGWHCYTPTPVWSTKNWSASEGTIGHREVLFKVSKPYLRPAKELHKRRCSDRCDFLLRHVLGDLVEVPEILEHLPTET